MKPDDIPQWAWDAAGEAWMQQVKWDEDRIVCDNITPIALALIEARSQAFEECATWAAIHSQYPITTDYDRGYAQARKDAAEKIRNRGERPA